MHRKALVAGIDAYAKLPALHYAEKDAQEIARRLRFHEDESSEPNFDVRLMLGGREPVTRATLRAAIHDLFADSEGLDLAFYFAGHGHVTDTGGHLVTADAGPHDHGVMMQEVTDLASTSRASSVLIMLDCCHAGAAGNPPIMRAGGERAILRDNMIIMAASLPMQQAIESPRGGGLFTAALRDALDGTASDFLGDVTVTSVYSLVEMRFNLWKQRPVVKLYLTRPIVLRKVRPRLSRQELRRIGDLFPDPDHKFRMEPAHDPERDGEGVAKAPEVPEKVEIGLLFKQYRDAGLLCASVSREHLYYVAQRSHTVELTPVGKEYWRRVKEGRV